MAPPYEIVILGNNLAGVTAAHYLLKHTFAALQKLPSAPSYHITLVGPSKHVYFKIAAPRALAAPDQITMDQITFPMTDIFAAYPQDQITWLQGYARAVSEDKKEVTVEGVDGVTKTLPYGSLIVCTGSKFDPLWAANDDFTSTSNAFAAMHQALPEAKTILIAGGGPVGVETAGEIVTKYPTTKITLLSGADRLLPRLSARSSAKAEKMLTGLGVHVVHHKKVTSPTQSAAAATTVTYDDQSTETYDVYIHAVGGAPNTDFLPAGWLDAKQKVTVDHDTFRAPTPDVYAFGDAAGNTNAAVMDIMFGVGPVMSSVGHDLATKLDPTAKPAGPWRARAFKPMANSQFVPIGPTGGIAQIMGWGFPSFVVRMVKAKTFFLEKARPVIVDGEYAKY